MATAAKRSPALSKLHARLLALGDNCCDLLKRDLRNARSHCQRQHCQRIWEAFDPEERETIRRKVVADDPHLTAGTSGYLLESDCVSVIEEELKQAGKLKHKRHSVQSKRRS